jgi:hypothetical protein
MSAAQHIKVFGEIFQIVYHTAALHESVKHHHLKYIHIYKVSPVHAMMAELHLLSNPALDATSRPGRFAPGNNVVSSETSVNCHHTTFHIPKDDGLHRHPVTPPNLTH